MGLYCGIDLHAKSSYLAIIDEQRKRVFNRNVTNDRETILSFLAPYRTELVGIVVESTFNWYWLVDTLMENDYTVHLANPCAIKQYKGLKYIDDKHDAFWLAELLSLGILKEGYIYPRQERPVRDLLRKRCHLMKLRTSLLVSLHNTMANVCGMKIPSHHVKGRQDRVSGHFSGNESLALGAQVSKTSIDMLTDQIKTIESHVEKHCRMEPSYAELITLPGIGKILGLTIMLETGPISRFPEVGNYVSVLPESGEHLDEQREGERKGQRTGTGTLHGRIRKLAEHARRFDTTSRNFYNRKLKERNSPVAHNVLANKLARAAYYIMRDHVPYEEEKLFG